MGNTLCCSPANVNEMMGGGLPPKLESQNKKYKEPINPEQENSDYNRI